MEAGFLPTGEQDKAWGVWAMFLDEYGKNGGAFSGQGAPEVFLFDDSRQHNPHDPKSSYDGPHLLGNSGRIVGYIRETGYDLSAVILRGKLGFTNTPSRDRFCEIRILPADMAGREVFQYTTPYGGYFINGFSPTHIVKAVLLISIKLIGRAFDYAVTYAT